MKIKLFLKAFLIFFLINEAISSVYDNKFIFQAHSYDDLRLYHQLFLKNLHYQPHENCLNQDETVKYDKRGCFLLIHDTPDPKIKYNTIQNFLELFIQPNYKNYLSDKKQKTFVAFCFKNTPKICENEIKSLADNNWISLVSEIYNDFRNKTKQLNIEFILDGDSKEKCVLNLFNEWIYTWIALQDPFEAFLNNDTTHHYDRFQVFNDQEVMLETSAILNWGKFKDIPRPLQVWEPADQDRFLLTAEIFQKHPHEYGYAWAINVDSAMFQTYVAEISKESWNNKLKIEGKKPKVLSISKAPDYNPHFLYFYLMNNSIEISVIIIY